MKLKQQGYIKRMALNLKADLIRVTVWLLMAKG